MSVYYKLVCRSHGVEVINSDEEAAFSQMYAILKEKSLKDYNVPYMYIRDRIDVHTVYEDKKQ